MIGKITFEGLKAELERYDKQELAISDNEEIDYFTPSFGIDIKQKEGLVITIRSQGLEGTANKNTGHIYGSLNLDDILVTEHSTFKKHAHINQLLQLYGSKFKETINLSDKFNLVPFLKYEILECNTTVHPLRRYDLQPSVLAKRASKIIVYCLEENASDCEKCNDTAKILAVLFDKADISILEHSDWHNWDKSILTCPPSFSKDETKLCLEHDLYDFEQYSLMELAHASKISDHVFVGTRIDNSVSLSNPETIPEKPHSWAHFYPMKIESRTNYSPASGVVPGSGWYQLGKLTYPMVEDLINTCKKIANSNGDVLLWCKDGYSELSFIVIAYIMYNEKLSVEDALLRFHKDKKRSLFMTPNDIEVLAYLTPLLHASSIDPTSFKQLFFTKIPEETKSLIQSSGPLPARILPYLYLGSLSNMQVPQIIFKLEITHIISIGTTPSWFALSNLDVLSFPSINDDGRTSLLHILPTCNSFITKARDSGGKVLVHCNMGVSRSACVVISHLMQKLSLMDAYLYSRIRKPGILIQPSVFLFHELLQYEYILKKKRSIEWGVLCRAVSQLNKHYFT